MPGFQKGFAPIIALVISTLIILGVIGTAFFIKNQTDNNIPAPSIFSSPSVSSKTATDSGKPLDSSFQTDNFVKRNYDPTADYFFDPSKTFTETFKYPPELIGFKDSELVGLKCSYSMYSPPTSEAKLYYLSKDKKQSIDVTDPFFLDLKKRIEKSNKGEGVISFNYCLSENNQKIIYYNSFNNSPTLSGELVVALELPDRSFRTIASLGGGGPYISCGIPLALTTKGEIYYSCSGGDVATSSDIHRVDINKKTMETIYDCYSDAEAQTGKPHQTYCK